MDVAGKFRHKSASRLPFLLPATTTAAAAATPATACPAVFPATAISPAAATAAEHAWWSSLGAATAAAEPTLGTANLPTPDAASHTRTQGTVVLCSIASSAYLSAT